MLADGFFKVYRSLIDHPIYQQCPDSVLRVWLACLAKANWRPSKWYDGHQQIELRAGAFVFGQESFAKTCRVSRQQLRTALEHLKNMRCITMVTTSQYSLLVVENWDTYQSMDVQPNQVDNQRITNGQPTGNQRVTTEEEVKKLRREEKQQGPPLISQTEWPESTAKIQRRWESVDGMFVLRLVQDSVQMAISCGVDPQLLTDSKLAEIIQESLENDFNGPRKNAGVLLRTVPAIIRTRAERYRQ